MPSFARSSQTPKSARPGATGRRGRFGPSGKEGVSSWTRRLRAASTSLRGQTASASPLSGRKSSEIHCRSRGGFAFTLTARGSSAPSEPPYLARWPNPLWLETGPRVALALATWEAPLSGCVCRSSPAPFQSLSAAWYGGVSLGFPRP